MFYQTCVAVYVCYHINYYVFPAVDLFSNLWEGEYDLFEAS